MSVKNALNVLVVLLVGMLLGVLLTGESLFEGRCYVTPLGGICHADVFDRITNLRGN